MTAIRQVWRRDVDAGQGLITTNVAWTDTSITSNPLIGLVGRMGVAPTNEIKDGHTDIQGTRMRIRSFRAKFVLAPYNNSISQPTGDQPALFMLCSIWRGAGATTDTEFRTLLANSMADDSEGTQLDNWAEALEGKVFTTSQGSLRLVRHKSSAYALKQSVPHECTVQLSDSYLREGEYLGWAFTPYPGLELYAGATGGDTQAYAYQTEIRYAMQSRSAQLR